MRRQNKKKYPIPFVVERDEGENTTFYGRYRKERVVQTDIGSDYNTETKVIETDADIDFFQHDQIKEKHGNPHENPFLIQEATPDVDMTHKSHRRGNPRYKWTIRLK